MWNEFVKYAGLIITRVRPLVESFFVGLIVAALDELLKLIEGGQALTLTDVVVVVGAASLNFATSWLRHHESEVLTALLLKQTLGENEVKNARPE